MSTINQLLSAKNRSLCTVTPDTSVFDALRKMAANDIGAVLVLDSGKLEGIFTERDYARKVILKGKSSKDTKVSELMTHDLYFVKPESPVEDCMAIMTERKIRYLPVIADNSLVGLISVGDVVRHTIASQQRHIEDLEKYFTGDEYGFYAQ